MRDTAGIKKLFLKLWSGAHYRRVAQVHWVARNKRRKEEINGLSKKLADAAQAFWIYLIFDSAVVWKEWVSSLTFNTVSSGMTTELYFEDVYIQIKFGSNHERKNINKNKYY